MSSDTFGSTTDGIDRREQSLLERIAANPEPALKWGLVAAFLVAIEFGALVAGVMAITHSAVLSVTAIIDVVFGLFSPELASSVVDVQTALTDVIGGLRQTAETIPTLLDRSVIPNQGYRLGPNGPWEGTFLGLSPAVAWAIRVVLVVAYSVFSFYWLFRGWLVYREHYRYADWTPFDDMVDRLRGHRWGEFGIVVLVLFLTMALFGPSLGPTTVEQNIQSPYSHELTYFSEESGSVETIPVGDANFNSKSKGKGEENVAPMTYDDFDRFHPFGTLTNGRDLFTFMMSGARITMLVAGISMGLASLIAITLSLASSYYAGLVDLVTLTTADGIVSVPRLLVLILVSIVFQGTWLYEVMDGGLLLALVFGLTTWPFLWRAVRGPALQVAESEWIDAAKSYGQRPDRIMRKHMLPFVLGYLLVYASMSVGGIIIGMSALSFLGNGLGISPPTPAWGRAISLGQNYVSTQSWHISFIPGIMIVILVTGLNAFGDGIRDAIDPESEGESEDEAAAGGVAG